MKKLAVIGSLLIASQATMASDCIVPAKFTAKNRDVLIVCLKNEIDALNGIPPASDLTQTIGDFMVATVKQATQEKMNASKNQIWTQAVFTLKNTTNEALTIGAISWGYNLSDDQGGSQVIGAPSGWVDAGYPGAMSTPTYQRIIPPNASVVVTLEYNIAHSAYTQPQTMSFGGNFYKQNADGTVETFGVQFNGVKISHP